MGGPESPSKGSIPSDTPSAQRSAASTDDSSARMHAATPSDTTPRPAAYLNAASSAANALVPSFDSGNANFHYHIRTPSTGLSLQTAFSGYTPITTATVEGIISESLRQSLRQSATAPITIQDQSYLRTAWSANSLGSASPSSLLSSPALNALGDITPLPSPLVMSDSPGPWQRAIPRPRGASSSSRDDFTFSPTRSTLSPSPSLKKKGYQQLKDAAAASYAQQQDEAARERNRSISDYTPDALHNIRPRHVTVGNVAIEGDTPLLHHLHREEYLATQRGLIPTKLLAGLPTPPASNASNKSVTDTEEEEVPEDDQIEYIAVRHGAEKTKTLWRPVRQLGQGTFSKVYLATCEKTKAKDPLDETKLDPRKLVAIKIVEHGPAGGADEERVELSLKREVEMLRSVSHPSLVHLQAFDHDDAQARIVLTYCPGGDLFDVASDHRDKLTFNVVQRIFAEMVSAVRYLHNQLIVHRDIKLENILLNIPVATVPHLDPQTHPHALATLTDLGLSRRIPAPPESPLLTTRCGSEDYAAPEILLGQPYDGRATDAWALGVLLYALMEGRLPFDPPPGKPAARSRAVHRIARCDWVWISFGDEDGEWDANKGEEWAGARECVEGLLKKASRGRKSLEEVENMEWVKQGIQVEGGLKSRPEDLAQESAVQGPAR